MKSEYDDSAAQMWLEQQKDNEGEKKQKAQRIVEYWLKEIEREKKAHKDYRDQAKAVEKILADEDKESPTRYNILHSIVEVLHSAVYSRTARPDVRRRFSDARPEEKEIALAVERAISYMVDIQDFDGNIDRAINDYLAAALGNVRVKYAPSFAKQELGGQEIEVIADQSVLIESYSYKHFRWEPSKSWDKVGWVSFDHTKKRKDVEREFGVRLEASDDDDRDIVVHEIYSKEQRKVYVITKDHPEPLEIREDRLGLDGFFPCPKPLLANLKTDKLIPKPDYCFYQDQAKALNELTRRISALVKSMRDKGFYDADMDGMAALEGATDGQLVPVENLIAKLNGTAQIDAVIAKWPIEDTQRVIVALRQEQEQVKQQIYEITGISDIVRGSSVASETATAQQIKGQWANVRLSRKQKAVNTFIRDIFRIMAEIVAEHFTPDVLARMTGVEITDELYAVMTDDRLRSFAIDVETDSTVAVDEREEQEGRMNMLQSLTGMINNLLPAVQGGAIPANLAYEMLLMSVRSFKHGRNLEDAIMALQSDNSPERALQELQQRLMQANEKGQQILDENTALKQQLSELNMRDEQRKDMETEGEYRKDIAEAEKKMVEADNMRRKLRYNPATGALENA